MPALTNIGCLATCAAGRVQADAGLFANAAVPPAVAEGRALLRTSCVATHQPHHLERGLEILHTVGLETGVLD